MGLLKWFEIDKAIIFVLFARGWQLLAAPLSILLIASYLTPDAQGFYYTFGSLLALQFFVELGFSLVIINVSSHEWTHLRLDPAGFIVGEPEALSRLISLGRLVYKWYAIASAIFILGVSIGGYFFFSQMAHPTINWQMPWFLLVTLTGLLLWILPFNVLLEGCNQVAAVNQFRFNQAIVNNVALWIMIAANGQLWSLVVAAGAKLAINLYFLLIQYRNFFKPFFKPPVGSTMGWRTEIWPMQWRLALSTVTIYFAFALYNIVMFQYHGAIIAGQMGITRQMVLALELMAIAWVETKIARFGMLIAQKEYGALDRFWLRVSLLSLGVISVGGSVAWVLVYVLNLLAAPLAQRTLSPWPTAIFLLASVVMHIPKCQIIYLRAHKQEPTMLMGVTTNLATGLLVWWLGSRFGPLGASWAYLVTSIITFVWTTPIWFRCRTKWHKSSSQDLLVNSYFQDLQSKRCS